MALFSENTRNPSRQKVFLEDMDSIRMRICGNEAIMDGQ